MVAGGLDIINAVGVEIRPQGKFIGPGDSHPFFDQGIDQVEEDGVDDGLHHSLAGYGTDGVHAGIEDGLAPDHIFDLVGMLGVQSALREDLTDPQGGLPGPGVEFLEKMGSMMKGNPDMGRS